MRRYYDIKVKSTNNNCITGYRADSFSIDEYGILRVKSKKAGGCVVKQVRDAMHGIRSLGKSCGKYDDWPVGVTMEMLEKHIPKKPLKVRVYHTKTFCPCCDTVIEYKKHENYYCDKCGQRLDWSDGDD